MAEYTRWCIKYPWHVTKDMPVPDDCNCEYCQEKRASLEFASYLKDNPDIAEEVKVMR